MNVGVHATTVVALLPSLALLVVLVRRGALRVKFAMLWLPVGAAMLVVAAVPGLLDRVAVASGITYPPSLIFALAIGLLMFVAIHLSWEVSRLEEQVRALAERIAINDVDEPAARSRSHAPAAAVGIDPRIAQDGDAAAAALRADRTPATIS